MDVLPHDGVHRSRPRDGEPRAVSEVVSQWLWRWRVELLLLYIAFAATATVLAWIL